MKRFKIQISQEVSNGKESSFFNRSKEEMMFQIILPDEEIDIKAVLKQIVAGRSPLTPYGEDLVRLRGSQ